MCISRINQQFVYYRELLYLFVGIVVAAVGVLVVGRDHLRARPRPRPRPARAELRLRLVAEVFGQHEVLQVLVTLLPPHTLQTDM